MGRLWKVVVISGVLAALMAPVALADEEEKAPMPEAGKAASADFKAVGSKASPLKGKVIVFADRSNPRAFWERFSVNARNCRVQEGAVIQLRDNDGTQAYVVDNRGTNMASTVSKVIGEGRLGRYDTIGFYVQRQGDGFMDKRARILGASRINC